VHNTDIHPLVKVEKSVVVTIPGLGSMIQDDKTDIFLEIFTLHQYAKVNIALQEFRQLAQKKDCFYMLEDAYCIV